MQNPINTILGIKTALAQGITAQGGEIASQTTGQLENLVTFIISQIPLWITGGIVIILSFFFAKATQSIVENKMAKEGISEEHAEMQILIGRVAKVSVLTIGITVGLKIAGIDLTTIIAAGAFGIGFALKDLIINFLAGVMILGSKHFAIGDVIKVTGTIGKIQDIQTRATIVKNFDGTKVVIPNAELFKNSVTNLSSNPFRRLSVLTGVHYESDLKEAVEACVRAAKSVKKGLIEPKPGAKIIEFADSAIIIKTNLWVDTKTGILGPRGELVVNIKKELDKVGISIPYPMRTIVSEDERKKEQTEISAKMDEEEKVEAAMKEETLAETPAPAVETPASSEPVAVETPAETPAPAETAPAEAVEAPVEAPVESNPEPAPTQETNAPTWLKEAAGIAETPAEEVPIPGVKESATIPEQPEQQEQPLPTEPAQSAETTQPAPATPPADQNKNA